MSPVKHLMVTAVNTPFDQQVEEARAALIQAEDRLCQAKVRRKQILQDRALARAKELGLVIGTRVSRQIPGSCPVCKPREVFEIQTCFASSTVINGMAKVFFVTKHVVDGLTRNWPLKTLEWDETWEVEPCTH